MGPPGGTAIKFAYRFTDKLFKRVFLLIVLEYSGQKNNVSKCFKLLLIFDLENSLFFFNIDGQMAWLVPAPGAHG
jgi:hypothetical protein